MNTGRTGRAGAATVNITPPNPVTNYGGNVQYRGPADSDILAHAVVLSDGSETAAIVSADSLAIGRGVVLAVKELCELRTGIPAANIFIGATHDHNAPHAAPMFLYGRHPDPLFLDLLTRRIVEAVQVAHSRMRPARLAAGQAPAPGITFNRRLLRPDGTIVHTVVMQQAPDANDLDPNMPPAGPVDEDVGYIWFEEPDGTPIACLMSFSCHNHAAGVPYFHRDMFGRAGQALQQRIGAEIPTPFLAGACGDTMWFNYKTGLPDDQPAYCWEIGRKIADAVIDHAKEQPRFDIQNLQMASKIVEIPDRPLHDSQFCDDLCRGHDEKALAFARNRYAPEEVAVRERGNTACVVEVSALAVGDRVALSTNPAELFVTFGLEIKERSPFDVTLISELTNGYCGYVPTEEAFRQKGYETHRAVFASRLAENGGRIITDGCVEMLERCKSGSGS